MTLQLMSEASAASCSDIRRDPFLPRGKDTKWKPRLLIPSGSGVKNRGIASTSPPGYFSLQNYSQDQALFDVAGIKGPESAHRKLQVKHSEPDDSSDRRVEAKQLSNSKKKLPLDLPKQGRV